MGRRALVTGGAGFVGANLVRRLLHEGHEVAVSSSPGSDRWRLDEVRGEIDVHECDLRSADDVTRMAVATRPEWVFHLAAHGGYSWQVNARRIFATNVLGTVNLVEATAGAEAFVHAGSSSEYGLKDHAPSEDEPVAPNSHYAVAKVAATLWLAQIPRGVTLRLYSVYGPWEDPGRLFPTLIEHARRGELPPLVSPETARDFVHVDDVCEAFLLATAAPEGSVFNVATGRQWTIREVVELVIVQFGLEAEPVWGSMPGRAWDTSTWVGDPSRIERELGWAARIDLPAGIAGLADSAAR